MATFSDSTLSLNSDTYYYFFAYRVSVTASKLTATVGSTLETLKRRRPTRVSQWRSIRWRSWWRKTWDPPCNTYKGKVSASCLFLSPLQSPLPRVTTGTLWLTLPTISTLSPHPTVMAHPLPECPWIAPSKMLTPLLSHRRRLVWLTFGNKNKRASGAKNKITRNQV